MPMSMVNLRRVYLSIVRTTGLASSLDRCLQPLKADALLLFRYASPAGPDVFTFLVVSVQHMIHDWAFANRWNTTDLLHAKQAIFVLS